MSLVWLWQRAKKSFVIQSFLNGQPIAISTNHDPATAVVTYSIYPGHEKEFAALEAKLILALPALKHFNSLDWHQLDPIFGRGSMAAEFCYLACGRIDGLVRLKQKPWDVAAGSIIAAEAGATMTNLRQQPCSVYEGDYLAANPSLLKKIFQIISNHERLLRLAKN
ncbi:hypothetical protein HY933_01240 [Candidatus Falkowbacteria bacterium]|nr:hypothetical protein [Candidatus Falkowbacteria bacterium]